MMFNRTITAIFLAGFFIIVLVFFNPIVFGLILSIIAILAFNEWIGVMNVDPMKRKIILILFISSMALLINFSNFNLTTTINTIYLLFWAIVSLDMLFGSRTIKYTLQNFPILLASFVMLCSWYLLLSFNLSDATLLTDTRGLIFSHQSIGDNLNYYFIFLFILVSFSDTSAYIVGKNFGSIPLCPRISPNKTVEGFLSSLIFPIVIAYIILIYFLNIEFLIIDFLFILICCVFTSLGDLFISSIKRFYAVKDTGSILPGHGGILDRIDSYLPVIPIFQLWLFL